MKVNAKHRPVLEWLAIHTKPLGEMCVGFDPIVRSTGMTRREVRRIVRHLARKGLVEFHRGLVNEYDGEFAGSGYCISEVGVKAEDTIP